MRLLCDTCVFGFIADDPKIEEITNNINKSQKFVICKFNLIRKEIRGKKHRKHKGRANPYLTSLYDKITKGKTYIENKKIKELAEKYYQEYKKRGGNKAKTKIMNDFKIVACASMERMDVLVSGDEKSLLSNIAKKSYEEVNGLKDYRTPHFWLYSRFREVILRN